MSAPAGVRPPYWKLHGRPLSMDESDLLRRRAASGRPYFLAGGADGSATVNIFDPPRTSLSQAADLNYIRIYPTVTALPDGTVLASGGSTPTFSRTSISLRSIPGDRHCGPHARRPRNTLPNYPHMFVEP